MNVFQITYTCFGLIGPHQTDAEIHIDRKIVNAIEESNLVPTDEKASMLPLQ